MTENAPGFEFERVSLPDVSRRASKFIAAVENATPLSPVSLADAITDGQENIEEMFAHRLRRADELYDRHHRLFFESRPSLLDTPDLEEGLKLTSDAITELQSQMPRHWNVMLGMGTMQLAAAANYLAHEPSLVAASGAADIKRALIEQTANLANGVFETDFADKIHGDINTFPHPRMGYLGHFLEMHFDFWRAILARGRIDAGEALAPELHEKIQKVLSRFPAKIRAISLHSLLGHPDRQFMSDTYQREAEAFQESVERGTSRPKDSSDNMKNAIGFLLTALDVAVDAGYSTEQSFRIVAQNSARIGRLTERVTDSLRRTDVSTLSLIGPRNEPQLLIGKPQLPYEEYWSEVSVAKLQRRDQEGGICVARHPVLLDAAGSTHKHVRGLSGVIKTLIGIEPPLTREVQGEVYLDPAALTVNYALLAIIHNYDSGISTNVSPT